jgi:1-acyl-sn-glycerol-3-phosphate acyltransferase
VYDLLPIHTRHLYPGELTLRVGDPIETRGLTVRQTDELTGRLRAAIEGLLHGEYAHDVDSGEVAAVRADA